MTRAEHAAAQAVPPRVPPPSEDDARGTTTVTFEGIAPVHCSIAQPPTILGL